MYQQSNHGLIVGTPNVAVPVRRSIRNATEDHAMTHETLLEVNIMRSALRIRSIYYCSECRICLYTKQSTGRIRYPEKKQICGAQISNDHTN